ncbi:hypothetical protein BDZ91DRAFT_742606 [Kalaharituber pfeilii]|nr:hypothetical protein BDZ91DRAFT_742606 [Kalaharituber pfeilii]
MTTRRSPTVNEEARCEHNDPLQRFTSTSQQMLQIMKAPLVQKRTYSDMAAATASSEPQCPLDIPKITARLRNESKEYRRREGPAHHVQARIASPEDLAKPLQTWITDRNNQLVLETEKVFTENEVEAPAGSIILLRYPKPIITDPSVKYNEWFMSAGAFNKQYQETAGSEWMPHRLINKAAIKEGIKIDKGLIELLGGDTENGRATIKPSWGGSMVIVEGGLLTKDGYGIGPKILEEYYEEVEGAKWEEGVR